MWIYWGDEVHVSGNKFCSRHHDTYLKDSTQWLVQKKIFSEQLWTAVNCELHCLKIDNYQDNLFLICDSNYIYLLLLIKHEGMQTRKLEVLLHAESFVHS